MVNDTVGTMMSCGYKDQSCEIGLIIGQIFFFPLFVADVLRQCGKSVVLRFDFFSMHC